MAVVNIISVLECLSRVKMEEEDNDVLPTYFRLSLLPIFWTLPRWRQWEVRREQFDFENLGSYVRSLPLNIKKTMLLYVGYRNLSFGYFVVAKRVQSLELRKTMLLERVASAKNSVGQIKEMIRDINRGRIDPTASSYIVWQLKRLLRREKKSMIDGRVRLNDLETARAHFHTIFNRVQHK